MNALAKIFLKGDEDVSFVDLMQFRRYRDFENGIIECKDGELMVGWNYTGHDHESASDGELDHLSYRLNDLLKSLGRGWAMWTEALRLETKNYPDEADCHFPDEVSLMIDRERRKAVGEQDAHFETAAFIVLMYKPPTKAAQRFYDAMIDWGDEAGKLTLEEKQLRYFRRASAGFESALSSIFPTRRLRPYVVDGQSFCDFLRLLHYCATGVMRPVRVPHPSTPIDLLICGQDFQPSFRPQVGEQYVGIVSVEGTHGFTKPAMLAEFDAKPLRYRWSTRYLFMDRVEATKGLEAYRRKWNQKVVGMKDQLLQTANPRVNRDAQRMVDDADEAAAELSSGDVNQGHYTSVFVLYSEDIDVLEETCQLFRDWLDDRGFGGRIEGLNATQAFLGSIPGNASINVDRAQLSTANVADLMPSASAWPGSEFVDCMFFPPESPPLIQAETPTSTPFRMNLHHNNVGHGFMGGQTRSGKSTALGLIAAQWLKYENAQVFTFESGMSMFPLCAGVGGKHFEIGVDEVAGGAAPRMMPLADIDTRTDLLWAQTWVEQCLTLQNVEITPPRRSAIQGALELLQESPTRTITEFATNLQDQTLREAMAFYTIAGPAGHILDGETEDAVLGHFNVFELRELMTLGDAVVLPTLLYLFRRIDKRLDGRPTLIPLDECWMMFRHPLFRDVLFEWLKTKAKQNTSVLMATQSITDAMNSGIIDTILSNTATKILLPHHTIGAEPLCSYYRDVLGLNPTEIELLTHGTPMRQYYYTSAAGRRMFELNLRPKTLAWIGRSGQADIDTLKALMTDHPDDWRGRWLEHCDAV